MNRKIVSIVQRIVPHYRISFFEALHEELSYSNIELNLVYGLHALGCVPEGVQLKHDWCEQANRLLSSHLILFNRRLAKRKIAFWGHGRNYQSSTKTLSEALKRKLTNKVDYWFAYTQSSVETISSSGFPKDKICLVNNTISTQEFGATLDLDHAPIDDNKISKDLGIFCGGLDQKKRIQTVFSVCDKLREKLPNFTMTFIGHGPYTENVIEYCKDRVWAQYEGFLTGIDKARRLHQAGLFIMPGTIGLVAIDSFNSKTPIATMRHDHHSPEFDYLINNQNALVTPDDEEEYIERIVAYFDDEHFQEKLRNGCEASARTLTMENMVKNFKSGIVDCLSR